MKLKFLIDRMISATVLFGLLCMAGCSKEKENNGDNNGNNNNIAMPLDIVPNVSLDSNPVYKEVTLSRNVETEGALLVLKNNSYWIKNLKLSNNIVSFNVEENNDINTGHRFDTIEVLVGNNRIGTICVTQARNRKSINKLNWCNIQASHYGLRIPSNLTSGKEITEYIYNIEKTTNGEDSYHNYPAFEFVIEMNHDPENNMEWHLGCGSEIPDMRFYSQFSDDFYWQANDLGTEKYACVFKYMTGATSKHKTEAHLVYALRNGSMDLD